MTPTFKLNDGNTIPAIGFGTGTKWFKYGRDELDDRLIESIKFAVDAGFTHIDGAEVYNTAKEIGAAIAHKKRDTLFITDKYLIGPKDGSMKSARANPYEGLKASLKEMNLDYVDLYLLHSQHISKETHGFDRVQAWRYLEQLKDEGLAKSIGVSNFDVDALGEILAASPKYVPAVNQIEYSPLLQNQSEGIVQFSKDHGILVESYSGLAPVVVEPRSEKARELKEYAAELGKKYGKTDSQVILRWVYQTGVLPITTSSNEDRVRSYLDVFSFELTESEVEKISDLGKTERVQQYKPFAP